MVCRRLPGSEPMVQPQNAGLGFLCLRWLALSAIGPCSVSRHEASTNPQCKSVESIKAHALWFPNTTAGFLSLELSGTRNQAVPTRKHAAVSLAQAIPEAPYELTCLGHGPPPRPLVPVRYQPDGTRQQAHLNLKLSQQSRWHHVRDKPQASTGSRSLTTQTPSPDSCASGASSQCLLVTGAALFHGQ
ncbi:hypothetical protein HDV57DRAFT_466003 [Trichoderma longibrachiatum]